MTASPAVSRSLSLSLSLSYSQHPFRSCFHPAPTATPLAFLPFFELPPSLWVLRTSRLFLVVAGCLCSFHLVIASHVVVLFLFSLTLSLSLYPLMSYLLSAVSLAFSPLRSVCLYMGCVLIDVLILALDFFAPVRSKGCANRRMNHFAVKKVEGRHHPRDGASGACLKCSLLQHATSLCPDGQSQAFLGFHSEGVYGPLAVGYPVHVPRTPWITL